MALFVKLFWLIWLTLAQGSAIRAGLDIESTKSQSEPTQPEAKALADTSPHTHSLLHRHQHNLGKTSHSHHGKLLEQSLKTASSNSIPLKQNCSSQETAKPHISAHRVALPLSTGSGKPVRPGTGPYSNSTPLGSQSQSPMGKAPLSNLILKPSGSQIMASADIFSDPISTNHPPSEIKVQTDHPVPRTGILTQPPLQTNKFFSNFFLGDQSAPTFTFPYSVAWAAGKGACASWGMAISHIEANQRVFGQDRFNGASSYYINPVGIQSMIISAKELGNGTTISLDSMTAFSARVNLCPGGGAPPAISFPLVQGMSCITGQFSGATPVIQTGVFFKTVTKATQDVKSQVSKFNFNLEDGTTWRVYAYSTKGAELDLQVINNSQAQSAQPFWGLIQVCKDPGTPGSEQLLDDGAGIYPVTTELTGAASGTEGSYTFTFSKAGHQMGDLYMFALPHHIDSFDSATKQQVKRSQLQSTTKGLATLVKGTKWTCVEPHMPVAMGFAPWSPTKGPVTALSTSAREMIQATAAKEVSQNMMAQTNLDSMYFSGKALLKFAQIMFVIKHVLKDASLLQNGLSQLQASFATFAANKQQYPLYYETAWGGVVSSATYVTGNSGADFGNTYYNDHHFHYGYHILAAAIIAYLDPSWLAANKDYVDTLVRDISNPSAKDKYFPMWRMFDWYHGHSWAHGLYASMDGKDQESSSEDMMHLFAIKMWGQVTGDKNMEMRGNLQLAVLARSLRHYYLYQADNLVQPKQFIGNKVAGILFENKVDHTTYFDPSIEAIQGIHMIPILPSTPYVRIGSFVEQEWAAFFSNGRAEALGNAWKSILFGNYATVNPKQAWEIFSSANFQPQWLDGGASLTWLMTYAAAMGGL